MERIKQYKEISRKPMYKSPMKKETVVETQSETRKVCIIHNINKMQKMYTFILF